MNWVDWLILIGNAVSAVLNFALWVWGRRYSSLIVAVVNLVACGLLYAVAVKIV